MSVMPQAKRQKTYDKDDNYQKTPPSHVVHARSLAENAREPELVNALQRYGAISSIIVMPKKRQALIEFDDISSAVNCVNDSARSQIFICGQQAFLNYSSHQKLVKQQGEGSKEQNNVLLFNIMNPNYPITVDVMHRICSAYGKVLRIVILRKSGVQAMVEYEDVKSAVEAKTELQGADIYADCCTISVDFSKIQKLNIFKNDQNSWDYVNDPEENKDSKFPRREQPPSYSSTNKYQTRDGRDSRDDRDSRDGRDSRDSRESRSNGASYRTSGGSMQSLMYNDRDRNGSHHSSNQLILMINNLDVERFNCDRLFNLLCLYGNVDRIKFLLTKEGSAMSQMNNAEPLLNVLPLINNTYIFGKKIHIHKSNQDELKPVSKPGELPDHTPSYKEFNTNRSNRYQTIEAAQKNKPIAPTNVVYWFNTPPGFDEEELIQLFVKSGAKPPLKVKVFQKKAEKSSTGLAEWGNITDCVEALVLTNHVEIEHPSSKFPYIFKLCFSSQPISEYHANNGNGNGSTNP